MSLMGEVMDDLKLRLKEYANSRVALGMMILLLVTANARCSLRRGQAFAHITGGPLFCGMTTCPIAMRRAK